MALLGDDGLGYELAKKLESCGVWRIWLGDSAYAAFVHFLSSPSAWGSFMRSDDSKARAQIHLQLRARALLFDKAAVSLFLRSTPSSSSSSSVAVSKLNPNYLQLHGDDVYFTLENFCQDGPSQRESSIASNTAVSKSKAAPGVSSRYGDSGIDSISQRLKHDDLPETWYSQFFERYRAIRPFKLSFGERESDKRTAEEMYCYLSLSDKNKRKRAAFKEDQIVGYGNSILENTPNMNSNSTFDANKLVDVDSLLLPESMFAWNCVPDSALPPISREVDSQKAEFHGIFDMLPQVSTRSPVMIERLGIRPEYLSMEQGGSLHRGRNGTQRNKKPLSQEQACQLSQKAVAKVLTNVGFEGATEIPMEVLSQLLGCHIRKLGRTLKILADSYRKQCSAIELLKMFLHTAGYSNLMSLAEQVKAGSRNIVQQTQQPHGIQSQMQPQQIRLPQQIPRQMHPQFQQMLHQKNLAFQQQQLERMRRLQPSTPRPGMDTDKDRPPIQVKVENQDLSMDGSAFNTMNARHPQMQFRQQPLAAMSNFQAQSANQFRQMASFQMPQMQTQNMNIVRPPPVKVEGFSELMGGDSSLKHDAEDNKLTSPSSK